VVDTDYGAMYAAYRPAHDNLNYWRFAQFLFPCYVMIPTYVLGLQVLARAWVPMDDEHLLFFGMTARSRRPAPNPARGGALPARTGLEKLPQSTDWYGRFRLVANARNDYLIDREWQRSRGDYTGIAGVPTQDQAITESMGPIYDRGSEHLGTSDVMVIRVRRRLIQAARALVEGRRYHATGGRSSRGVPRALRWLLPARGRGLARSNRRPASSVRRASGA